MQNIESAAILVEIIQKIIAYWFGYESSSKFMFIFKQRNSILKKKLSNLYEWILFSRNKNTLYITCFSILYQQTLLVIQFSIPFLLTQLSHPACFNLWNVKVFETISTLKRLIIKMKILMQFIYYSQLQLLTIACWPYIRACTFEQSKLISNLLNSQL